MYFFNRFLGFFFPSFEADLGDFEVLIPGSFWVSSSDTYNLFLTFI